MPVSRLLSALWLPALLVGGAVLLAARPAMMPVGAWSLPAMAPYAGAAIGALLAARFHQSRAVFALAILAAGAAALDGHPLAARDGHALAGLPGYALAGQAALVLVPLNLLAVAFLGEKGVLTGRGMFRLAVIAAQAAAVAWLATSADTAAVRDARALLTAGFVDGVTVAAPLGQPALAALGLAGLGLAVRWARSATPPDAGLLAALAAVALAGAGFDARMMLSAATLAVTVSVVQEGYRLAYRDELTGLPGRRALMTEMGKLGGRWCVAMLDVDHFKKFNDTYGHDVGDQVLQMVAARVARVGGGGTGFRYGGEEFTVLFPGRSADGAHEHLEALRAAIEAAGFKLRAKDRPKGKPAGRAKAKAAKTVSVTVSIGAADQDAAPSPDAALKVADANLYKAKKAGRNRLVG